MPLSFKLARASSAKSGNTGEDGRDPDSGTRVGMTAATDLRDTRRASSACTLSSANWNVLNPVTRSNESSSQGNASMSPTRSRPRARARRDLDQLCRRVDATLAHDLWPCARSRLRTRSQAHGCPSRFRLV